jgi:eukaryotic-like serine/threonine-protein kinase
MHFGQAAAFEPNWPTLSGTALSGGYEVQEILEANAHTAKFRVRVLGDWSAKAMLDAFCASGPAAEDQVGLWLAAKELRHPNLNSPLASGQVEHEGVRLIYVVMPAADENLAALLRERAVTIEEAREILLRVRRGLEYMHSQGWVHGHLSPEQVLAVGDSVRISAEYAGQINAARPIELISAPYVAPEAFDSNTTPAADVWCLGATLFQALTGKSYSPEVHGEIAGLPQPLAKIVERCLDVNPQTRLKLDEIDVLTITQRWSTAPVTKAEITSEKPAARNTGPVLAPVAPRNRPAKLSSSSRLWIYAAALGVCLLLAVFLVRPKHRDAVPAAEVPIRQPVPTKSAAPKPSVNASKPVAPRPTPSIGAPASRTEADSTTPATMNGPVWRVVVFTYSRQPDAAKKANSLNEKHPQLDAKVFSPAGHGSLYLVTIGGKMSRPDAMRMRQQAIHLGLPRDSYIQNYRQ